MVALEEGVRPGARPPEAIVDDHGRALEHRELLAVGLEALVGADPDAAPREHLADAVVGPAAGTVALALRALGFGAEVGDVGQRAVAAVPAVVERHLDRLLQHVQRPAEMGLLELSIDAPGRAESGRPGREDEAVREAVRLVPRRTPATRPTARTGRQRAGVPGCELVGREAARRVP